MLMQSWYSAFASLGRDRILSREYLFLFVSTDATQPIYQYCCRVPARNEDSVLLPSDRDRTRAAWPIIDTQAEWRFVSTHCHGRLGVSCCAEADAGSGILLGNTAGLVPFLLVCWIFGTRRGRQTFF